MVNGEADQVIDMTDPKGAVRHIAVLTPAGIVRVNVDLVVVRTGQPAVSVEIEPNLSHRPTTAPGGHWDLSQREHTGRGLEVSLHRREGS
jgi:hypothetical protein